MSRLNSIWHQLPESWRFCLPLWAVLRVATSLLTVFIWKLRLMPTEYDYWAYRDLQPVVNGVEGALLGMWQRWDGIHYQTIAQSGYSTAEVTVFFPLYPYLSRGLSRITGISELAVLFVVSSLAFLFAMVLLFELVKLNYSRQIAQDAVIAACFFPTSFFFLALYPQGLALALILLSVLLAQKNQWLAACIVSILTGLTHGTGVPLAILLFVLAINFLREKKQPLRWSVVAVPFMPLAGTALFFAWRIFNHFPSINTILSTYFHRVFIAPWTTFLRFWELLPANVTSPDWIVNGCALLILLVGIIWGVKKLPLAWELYSVALFIFILTSGVSINPLNSFSRYCLTAFPMYALIGMWTNSKKRRLATMGLGAAGCLFLLSLFLMWEWIA